MNINPSDNLFPVGTLVTARINPGEQLIIESYCQRIYYCRPVAEPDRRNLAFYERELTTALVLPGAHKLIV